MIPERVRLKNGVGVVGCDEAIAGKVGKMRDAAVVWKIEDLAIFFSKPVVPVAFHNVKLKKWCGSLA